MRERAVAQYERLRTIVPDTNEIVFVLTRDVYHAAMTLDTTPYNRMTAGFGRNGIYGLFQGVRVCVVNEQIDTSMFAPAVCGRVYYHGMQLEDVILIEDNHLYSLRRIEPDVMFVDTGLTVSFGDEQQAGADAAADAATTVTVDNTANTVTIRNGGEITGTLGLDQVINAQLNFDWDEITRIMAENTPTIGFDTARAVTFDTDNAYINHELFGRMFATTSQEAQYAPKRQAKPKEEELNPGDTKALDDFLSGFMKSAT